ncbi:glutathione S-transferase C-terminal domain-containing protein [Leeia sp. TBRC 13508]|uniref:Glutathione S-transferase C-terminal domain-containing protein n=1 Tax=Leeia speluncae TaxID=2884804 RepID=A0ABS8DB49_9NEIS|nr:glutathione S-transferase C-terminal domain-containing protein [Leeia speluncae]MCB6185141.1 glutathione S-transferase C-terminal domain-containing protein [Leeia speluncae]
MIADAKRVAFRKCLGNLESALVSGPFFSGATFGMVDAVYAPLFRYFRIIDELITHQVFDGFPRTFAWHLALAAHPSVKNAVNEDYAARFKAHLQQKQVLIPAN